jgi:hypothetical protein
MKIRNTVSFWSFPKADTIISYRCLCMMEYVLPFRSTVSVSVHPAFE